KIIKSIFTLVKDMARKIIDFDWVGVGRDIIGGLIKGIKNMTSRAIEAITGVVGGIVNKAKSLLKISSPSKLFKQFGEWLSEGLSIGIEADADEAIKATEKLAKGVSDSFSGGLKGILKNISLEAALGQ